MKHFCLTFFLLFYTLFSWGQNQDSLKAAWKVEKKLDQQRLQYEIEQQKYHLRISNAIVKKSDFIFEGVALSFRHNEVDGYETNVYALVRVIRVFRGDTSWEGKTLEVGYVETHHSSTSIGQNHSVFFCQPKPLLPNPQPFQPELSLSLTMIASVDFSPDQDLMYGLEQLRFDSREEFFRYLSTHSHINLTALAQSRAANVSATESKPATNTGKSVSYQEWYKHWIKKVQQAEKKSSKTGSRPNTGSGSLAIKAITFSFANQTVTTSGGKSYFEVDIMTAANVTGTYLDNALFRLQYSPTIFGPNIHTNGKLTVSKGASFNTPTYFAPTDNLDVSESVVAIPFGFDFTQTSPNRTMVPTSPTVLIHLKIQLTSC
jgi:hypothetical protein